jgi:hypothetical protein
MKMEGTTGELVGPAWNGLEASTLTFKGSPG